MSDMRKFRALLKEHGMEVRVIGNGHNGIFKDGKRVYAFAGSPKNHYQAIDNNIKDLVRDGHLPNGTVYRGRTYKRKDTFDDEELIPSTT